MPKGVYPRTQNQLRQARINLAGGRTPEVRRRAAETLRKTAATPEWRKKVSEGTKRAMHRPDVRKRHLRGLKRALKKHGVGFKGGNGQPMTAAVAGAWKVLEPLGFIREYPVRTRGHGTGLTPPGSYKVDFGHPGKRVAVELDGPSHGYRSLEKDRKKTAVLEALGWRVIRVRHR